MRELVNALPEGFALTYIEVLCLSRQFLGSLIVGCLIQIRLFRSVPVLLMSFVTIMNVMTLTRRSRILSPIWFLDFDLA